jgi:ribosomal protein S18 acetylase RimI-like enzyme
LEREASVRLIPLIPADIERVKPLWLSLHEHHQQIAPQLAPFVDDETSWTNRKKHYAEVFAGEHFGFIAQIDGRDVGYLLCAKRAMQWQATFAIPKSLWELVTIIVLPEARGAGIGTLMFDALEDRVAASDVQSLLIGVIPSNLRTVEFYRRLGLVPGWITLTRYQRQSEVPRRPSFQGSIQAVGRHEVDTLDALWLSLHHHHQAVSPGLGPWVEDKESWPVVRELFKKSSEDGLLLVAKSEGAPVGVAAVAIHDVKDSPLWTDTLVTDNLVAETKFLVVGDDARGKGVGTALVTTVDATLAARGIHDDFIGAIAPNADAIRFFESLGYRQSWLEMLRLKAA